eukprot:1733275-Prorocentrum_lima.AAC.1
MTPLLAYGAEPNFRLKIPLESRRDPGGEQKQLFPAQSPLPPPSCMWFGVSGKGEVCVEGREGEG